ncbi:hypothetical protein [Alicyclobacillus suci]|uniref:hypothetical protein n=1 Tax=Alicyclobacillus suci TaxID=2816080 RepID=UPI001F3977C7|nr:hypothetical protein [Alicyclobacillus suci]
MIPQDLLTNSTMPTIGSIMICPLIIHMGTLIPLRTIRKQWRAVCINLIGLLITAALILIVGLDTRQRRRRSVRQLGELSRFS